METRRIESADNETVKRYAALKEKKYRKLYGMYLLEGARIVKDALTDGAEIEAVFVREEQTGTGAFAVLQENISCDSKSSRTNLYILSEKAFLRLSDTETPQGIIAAAKIPQNRETIFSGRGLLLDGISDSGNLGTLIRSAAGFGYKDIFLINCADPYAPKTVRSTMSGIFKVNIRETGYEIIERLKKDGVQFVCADMGGEDASAFRPKDKFVLCIGGEAHGLSAELKAAADKVAAIKQQNIESLNAAVAGSILMYLYFLN